MPDNTITIDRELAREALAVAESELKDMRGVDPDEEGPWTKRVRSVRDRLAEELEP